MTEFISIAAVSENGVIGDGSRIPWDYPEDTEFYRDTVSGEAVVVGRITYEVMRGVDEHPLVVVLTRGGLESDPPENVQTAASASEAATTVKDCGYESAFILGGEGVYDAFFPRTDELIITHIPGVYDGDVHFPNWEDREEWEVIDRTNLGDELKVVRYDPGE